MLIYLLISLNIYVTLADFEQIIMIYTDNMIHNDNRFHTVGS